MRICFVGMGSIGQRHVKNIVKAAKNRKLQIEIHVYRTSGIPLNDEIKSFIDKEIFEEGALDKYYDIVFVTNQTSLHYETIKKFSKICSYMFIEKPIFDVGKDAGSLMEELKIENLQNAYVACPMRYTDVFVQIKEVIENKTPCAVRIICSSYMPEWQKGRDYRKSFRTRVKEGGGVDIDLIHEIDYMVCLFGMPHKVYRVSGHYSKLEMDACDLASYIFEYDHFLVEMHLDYFGRSDKRNIEIYTDDEVIEGDFLSRTISFKREGRIVHFDKDVDHYYREIDYFLNMVLYGKENVNDVLLANKVLKLAKGEI